MNLNGTKVIPWPALAAHGVPFLSTGYAVMT
jgi:hypothetical protein